MTLPATSRFTPRPVWSRLLRRLELNRMAEVLGCEAVPPLGAPTEEEKHDAIEVLRDYGGRRIQSAWSRVLLDEAERIFVEGAA